MLNLLIPAYQPIVDLGTGEVSHWEALARIPEDETDSAHVPLIQLAERHRFIHKVDLAMAQLALEDLYRHPYAVAINLSPHTIEVSAQEVLDLFARHGGFVRRLIVEITESLAIVNVDRLQRFIGDVRQLGARVALDDYGRGCFTERLVRTLQPEFLKLAGEMVHRFMCMTDAVELDCARQLVAGFNGLLIAEHVDTLAKAAFLKANKVPYGQGELFGMPARALPGTVVPTDETVLSGTDVGIGWRASGLARPYTSLSRQPGKHIG